jgi:DNA polymerase-3 subunit chi
LRADFYILSEPGASGRLKVACRLAEKAYQTGQRVLIWHSDKEELTRLDELLWTFSDTSFVPHEWVDGGHDAPVLLSAGAHPAGPIGVLINLATAPEPPPSAAAAERVAEIVAPEPPQREAARARFRAYRQLGCEPVTHTLRGA